MKRIFLCLIASSAIFFAAFTACNKDSSSPATTTSTSLPDAFKQFNSTVQVYTDGDYIIIKSDGVPDHKSPYFDKSDARYEAYNGTNASFESNGFSIGEKSYTFKIPLNPARATTSSRTPLGPIGVALNGVPLFNQYNGNNQPLGSMEINSFDQYNGHPAPGDDYHYHAEPLYITATKSKTALIGFLLDGFPVYGPQENGKTLTNDDLDANHGHFSGTAEYPNGIYHYHVTADAPYINGSGFYGTAGSVTQ